MSHNLRLPAAVALTASTVLVGLSFAQENWGFPQTICEIAGCAVNAANPSFYDSSHVIFEVPTAQGYWLYVLGFQEYEPVELPGEGINIENVNNVSPFVTFDGDRLFFASDRAGGYGGSDIWVSEWGDSQWLPPVNLGPNVNSAEHDLGPSLPLAEDELFFWRTESWSPDGFPDLGNIYRSDRVNGEWAQAVELPPPINVNGHSYEPSITSDGAKLYFISYRPEIAEHIFAYVSYWQGDSWADPVLLNSNVNRTYDTPPFWFDSGDVVSSGIDRSGMSILFTHYATIDGFITGEIRLSQLVVGIESQTALPLQTHLEVYPNPFNDKASIRYSLTKRSSVQLNVFDIAGRLVRPIYAGDLDAGPHAFMLDASGLTSGVYIARMEGENEQATRFVLLK